MWVPLLNNNIQCTGGFVVVRSAIHVVVRHAVQLEGSIIRSVT